MSKLLSRLLQQHWGCLHGIYITGGWKGTAGVYRAIRCPILKLFFDICWWSVLGEARSCEGLLASALLIAVLLRVFLWAQGCIDPQGDCSACAVPRNFCSRERIPHCGSDGVTYASECLFRNAFWVYENKSLRSLSGELQLSYQPRGLPGDGRWLCLALSSSLASKGSTVFWRKYPVFWRKVLFWQWNDIFCWKRLCTVGEHVWTWGEKWYSVGEND